MKKNKMKKKIMTPKRSYTSPNLSSRELTKMIAFAVASTQKRRKLKWPTKRC